MKRSLCLLFVLISMISCKEKSEKQSMAEASNLQLEKNTIRKIDVHSHYKEPRDYLTGFFKKWNMQAVLVDVSITDSTKVRRSWDSYLAHKQAYPDLFSLCSSFIGVDIDSPEYAERIIEQLKGEIASGAGMVKVWKNFGMVTKDKAGNYIQIDDPRLQPIWDYLVELDIPVMAHIAEPIQAWRPLDDPNNPHFGYYTDNPQYHAYTMPEIPTYETIIKARDNWISSNPKLRVLCAHVGSMSHDVDMVSERLDTYPNMQVELGARFGDIAGQDSKKVKSFIEKYQDRVMFGTDYGTSSPQESMTAEELQTEMTNLDARYTVLWDYLSGSDSLVLRKQHTKGLGLSKEVLEKVYFQNAADFLKIK